MAAEQWQTIKDLAALEDLLVRVHLQGFSAESKVVQLIQRHGSAPRSAWLKLVTRFCFAT
jgi:hypothetical protein